MAQNTKRAAPKSPSRPARTTGAARAYLASFVGFAVAASGAGAVVWGVGCDDETADSSSFSRTSSAPADAASVDPTPVADATAAASADAPKEDKEKAEEEPEKPWEGPWLGVMAFQTPVYAEPRFGDKRIGYIRHGGKVPVIDKPIKKSNCNQGWYELVDGGFVCGKYASTDLDNPRVKLGVSRPDLEATVPYQYAYNRKNGTPLYKSVPSREDMLKYEPYLNKKKEAAEEEAKDKAKGAKHVAKNGADESSGDAGATDVVVETTGAKRKMRTADDEAVQVSGAGEGSAEERLDDLFPEEAEEPEAPWWQDNEDSKDVNVTLAELEAGADSNLSKRMVKGFFVAVDKSFGWNDRLWYKTTSGLVAPSDRMYINKPPGQQGLLIPEGVNQVGFITSAKATKFVKDGDAFKKGDPLERFAAFGLTGKSVEDKGTVYRETVDGWWMKGSQGTFTDPPSRPSDVGEDEKWIAVNLTRKTLIAFDGKQPYYAALVSPGKKSRNKKKDHRTPTGKWRIREKHIAVTMDGDGASGDLPYSIEDVPYVAYYKGSYALHGAFWHNSFGSEMSHGCVNLAPRDAKAIFMWAGPHLPRGWHAVWATDKNPGTMVVVHE